MVKKVLAYSYVYLILLLMYVPILVLILYSLLQMQLILEHGMVSPLIYMSLYLKAKKSWWLLVIL